MNQISVYNIDQHPTQPFDTFVELQGDLKQYTETRKLADRIASVGFKYDFLAWETPDAVEHHGTTYPAGTLFIVDAHSRQRALHLLRQDGWEIPSVPFTRVHAASLEEAKAELLFLNSQYGVLDFDSDEYEEILSLLDDVSLPQIALPEVHLDELFDTRDAVTLIDDHDEGEHGMTHESDENAGGQYPVALLFTQDEYTQWQEMKARLNVKTDTQAAVVAMVRM